MPYYNIVLNGKNISLKTENLQLNPDNKSDVIIGFYATRIISALNVEAAKLEAIRVLKNDWKNEPFYESEKRAPTITISQTNLISWYSYCFFRLQKVFHFKIPFISKVEKGYTFYLSE